MTTHVLRWWFAITMVLLAIAGPAAADDKSKQAASHYRQGLAFEKAGSYDQAIAEYKAAYALDTKASHLFNIARMYEAKNDPRGAVEYYDKFLAIESEGANAKKARESKVLAVKKVTEEDDRKKAEDDARKKAEDAKRRDDEVKAKKIAAENHLKQAADFAQSNRWANAADEYRKATDADGDPEHLFEAAEAFRKVPDLAKARATFEQYRDKVQVGGRSDLARKKIAEIADEMAKVEQADRDRKVADSMKRPPPLYYVDKPRKRRLSKKWLLVGGAMLLGGLAVDLLPASGENGKLDGTDFIAPLMYGLGATAVIVGVF
jgi:tetratricopeptide (TPR) repeat protein